MLYHLIWLLMHLFSMYSKMLKERVNTGEGGIGAKRLVENKEELDHATQFLHDNGKFTHMPPDHRTQTDRQTDRQTDTGHRQTDTGHRQTDPTDRQTDRQTQDTDRQTRQTDRQTDRHSLIQMKLSSSLIFLF